MPHQFKEQCSPIPSPSTAKTPCLHALSVQRAAAWLLWRSPAAAPAPACCCHSAHPLPWQPGVTRWNNGYQHVARMWRAGLLPASGPCDTSASPAHPPVHTSTAAHPTPSPAGPPPTAHARHAVQDESLVATSPPNCEAHLHHYHHHSYQQPAAGAAELLLRAATNRSQILDAVICHRLRW